MEKDDINDKWWERDFRKLYDIKAMEEYKDKWLEISGCHFVLHIPLILLSLSGTLANEHGKKEVCYEIQENALTIAVDDIEEFLNMEPGQQLNKTLKVNGELEMTVITQVCVQSSSDTNKLEQ
ncbi:hypothetical protein [Coprothermobacter platensis]|uniref:hypothetical protein n=1 Tax=Coprothermobacter platensis TaxID=108819 RepID=UPI00036E4451|nr:hypothetical protein [Coprothermobacter platensis]